MKEITEIYRGYLGLIEYLEEKFLGGVYAAYRTECLLVIMPATEATRNAFVVPACDKFNALGSTQLKSSLYKDAVVIETDVIAPTLYIVYAIISQGFMDANMERYIHPLKRVYDCLSPQVADKAIIEQNAVYLKYWLETLVRGTFVSPNFMHLKNGLETYQVTKGRDIFNTHHVEAAKLASWLTNEEIRTDKLVRMKRKMNL